MLHNPKQPFQIPRDYVSPTQEARRLRLEYNRLQRRLTSLAGRVDAEVKAESDALWRRVDRIARDLGAIRADSVHAVESKLKVALDLMGDDVDETSHRLLTSALSDLHFLALLSEPRAN
jgi:hypothetical protein